jgi:hypothetical protein
MASPTVLTPEKVRTYVRAAQADSEFITDVTARASAMIDGYIGEATVPPEARAQAALEVAANLYHRRATVQDHSAPTSTEAATAFFRPALDPLTPARPILAPYLQRVGLA